MAVDESVGEMRERDGFLKRFTLTPTPSQTIWMLFWASCAVLALVVYVPRLVEDYTTRLEFDPEVKGIVWAVFGRNHDLPRPKMWRTTDPSRFQRRGAAWTKAVLGWSAEGVGRCLGHEPVGQARGDDGKTT